MKTKKRGSKFIWGGGGEGSGETFLKWVSGFMPCTHPRDETIYMWKKSREELVPKLTTQRGP